MPPTTSAEILQDSIGNFIPKFKDTSWRPGVWISTAVMVAGWGAILIMGVTDPLGGINTLFPLFGIANQLLAAIALAVVLAIVAKRGRSYFKWLWIVAVPLAFAAVVTITASMYKIFSTVPQVGYWANHNAFKAAREAGETSFGTAGTVEAMDAVIRNTFIQGTLSIIFVSLAIVVITTAVISTIRSIRNGGGENLEDAPVASRRFAPAGFIATKEEREIEAEWAKLPADQQPASAGH